MPDIIDSPVKLKIRADNESGLIRAFFAMTDGSDEFEIGTFHLGYAQRSRPDYEIWVAALTEIFRHFCEEVGGVKVASMQRIKPSDNN